MTARRTGPALATAMAMVLAAGCSTSSDKDEPLQTRTLAEVTQQADLVSRTIADAAGSAMTLQRTDPLPCTGRAGETTDDGRWYLSTGFNLPVTADDLAPAFDRIRTALTAQGWEITSQSTFADDTRIRLDARHSPTGHTASLTTTSSGTQIAVFLSSTCAKPARS